MTAMRTASIRVESSFMTPLLNILQWYKVDVLFIQGAQMSLKCIYPHENFFIKIYWNLNKSYYNKYVFLKTVKKRFYWERENNFKVFPPRKYRK